MAAKIVVVDDSPTIRTTIALALERKGYRVVQGSNGLEGITLSYRENPDLLVSDIVMPELNGYQVCRLLKNDPATEDLPIILLTTLDHQQHRFWGKEAGADSYVLKAADLTPLENEVARLLKEKKRLPAPERQRKGSPIFVRQGAQARLTDLLDRLLFEATIRGRIREIGQFSGDTTRSLQGFFEFFQNLVDYAIVLLCLRAPDRPLVFVHLNGKVPAGILEAATDAIWKEGLLAPADKEGLETKVLNPECLTSEKPGGKNALARLAAPFSEASQEGGLAVFNRNPVPYTEETGNTLKIVARELEPILRFNLQAEAMEKLKADFGAMIVHDLRSPLTVTTWAADLVADGMAGPVNEEQKKWLSKIGDSVRSMLGLVNDFLDLSKIEAGRLELVKEEVDIKQLIQITLENYTVLAQGKKISLSSRFPHPPARIQADPRRLEQVFGNLLSNAIKFTGEGGEVEVGATQEAPAEVLIWVKDTGVGISPHEVGQIFEKYRQTTSGKTSKHKGTGLGLVICKMIVESHGGRIWVESEEGKGTTFFFALPSNP